MEHTYYVYSVVQLIHLVVFEQRLQQVNKFNGEYLST